MEKNSEDIFLRVLLAEDDLISQKLAVLLIKRKGWEIEAVFSGDRVFPLLQEKKFDIILMDIQMPLMDGFEATRQIRENERLTGEHIPIIALTAHAMKGDMEKCMEAGMDEYISKPIDEEELYKKILSVHEKFSINKNGNRYFPADFTGLLKLLNGSSEDLCQLIKEFLKYYSEQAHNIKDAIEDSDSLSLEKYAHKLKGSLANFRAKKACDLCYVLEKKGRNSELSGSAEIFSELSEELELLHAYMTEYCEHM